MSKLRERKRVRRPLVAMATWAGTLVRWRVHRMLPGMAGACLVSAGGGELAGHIWHRGLAPWVGLLLAGGFVLWIGAAINQAPRTPPNDS